MAKVKSRNKNGSLIVDVRLPFGSELNERELSQLARKSVRGLLSAKKKWGGVIEYTGPMGISLSERLQQQIGKQDFICIMAQVVSITQKLQGAGRHHGAERHHPGKGIQKRGCVDRIDPEQADAGSAACVYQ